MRQFCGTADRCIYPASYLRSHKMTRARMQTSPFLLLWLLAALMVGLLSILQKFELRFVQQLQTDETLLREILANVAYDNDPASDTFLLDPANDTFLQSDL